MVVLHGLGDSMEGYQWLPEGLRIPNLSYVLTNAPDPYYDGFSWYEFDGVPRPGVERSRELLEALITSREQAGTPRERLFLLGFSQGCLMSVETASRSDKPLAGVVGISGYVLDPTSLIENHGAAIRDQRFWVSHGTRDPILPVDRVRQQYAMLKEAGWALEYTEYPKDHTIYGEAELRAIRDFVVARMQA